MPKYIVREGHELKVGEDKFVTGGQEIELAEDCDLVTQQHPEVIFDSEHQPMHTGKFFTIVTPAPVKAPVASSFHDSPVPDKRGPGRPPMNRDEQK